MCDRDGAITASGATILRLEVASLYSLRRKPFNAEGNHKFLNGYTKEMFITLAWDSELFHVHYTRICEDAGLHNDASYGSEAHMRSMWKLAEGRLMGAVAGMDATNGRWWTVDAEARQKRPLSPI